MSYEKIFPLVSVCIPTYNRKDYIEQAIKGVLMQQDCDFEIIISDDKSTDHTLFICEKYTALYPEKIKLITQPHNKGVIENTKECLLACSGKYIAICEGDDYWIDSLKLKKQTDILELCPDVSMVHSNWVDFYQSEQQFQSRNDSDLFYICEHNKGKDSVEEIMMNKYRGIRFSSICFRKEYFLKALEDDQFFSPHYTTCDIVFFYELAFQGILAYQPEATTVYRIQAESVSISSNIHKKMKFSTGVLHIKSHFIKKYQLSNSSRDAIFRNSLGGLFVYALEYRDRKLANELKELSSNTDYSMRIGQWLCYYGCKNLFINKIVKFFFKFKDYVQSTRSIKLK